jgi:hypothetical protein
MYYGNTYIYLLIQVIPTYTCNTSRHGAAGHAKQMPKNAKKSNTYRYCNITTDTYSTFGYLIIHKYTCQYLKIHAHTCLYLPSWTWNSHISATIDPFDMSQRTVLITVSDRQMGLVCGTFYPFATIWLHIENWTRGHSLVHQNTENNPPISSKLKHPVQCAWKGG